MAQEGNSNTMDSIHRRSFLVTSASLTSLPWLAGASGSRWQADRRRCSDLGIKIGHLATGDKNAIVDIDSLSVGHRTVSEDDNIRTGVSVILPHDGNLFKEKVPAGFVSGNGFGKFVGTTQLMELGCIETPIALTNTLSTFTVADALIKSSLRQKGNESVRSVNPIVGECNDGYLNDIRGQHVATEHLFDALQAASPEEVGEGCLGAGTGTQCLGWKGGIGTASRKLPESVGDFQLGVLVQTNFGGSLTVAGVPVGAMLNKAYLQSDTIRSTKQTEDEKGSCVVVVATDAPLDSRQLTRVARRALFGLAAVGSPMTHGSGDYVIAFSTHPDVRRSTSSRRFRTSRTLVDERLSPLFQAARDATEEAVLNSMFMATTTIGRDGNRSEAIDLDVVLRCCRERNLPLR